MKKILILFVCMFMLISCIVTNEGKTQVNYTICYPDTTIIKDSVFEYKYVKDREYQRVPVTSSYKGSNCIYLGAGYQFEHTTCPIRINSYKIIK